MQNRSIIVAFVTLAACCLAITSADAQTDYSNRKATSYLTIGAGFAGGASINTESPKPYKLDPIFAYRTGIDITYPLTPVIGASLGLGLDSRGSKRHVDGDNDIYNSYRINFLSITPAFRFSAFFLGVNFGFPLSATTASKSGKFDTEHSSSVDAATLATYNTMIEPRIGAVITLMDEEVGWLGLTLAGGYAVNQIVEIPSFVGTSDSDDHLVSAHIGLTWQFAIPDTQRK